MHKRIIQLGLFGLVVIGGTMLFLIHGRKSSEPSKPDADASQNPVEVVRSAAGIAQLARASVADIREMNLLWKDLDALKQQARELGPAEYKIRCIQRTATFLQLAELATAQFAKKVDLVLRDFKEARERMQQAHRDVAYNPDNRDSVMRYRAAWEQYSKDRQAAVGRVASTLASTPRRQLFAEQSWRWILRLEQGSEEASKQSQTKESAGR